MLKKIIMFLKNLVSQKQLPIPEAIFSWRASIVLTCYPLKIPGVLSSSLEEDCAELDVQY